ncbi:GNAT family N-acetyltransferase [Clostridium polynesiense]|uniref:GNAT family N-acetyltransferase n=1 Tax=Clostridium polynesiense TaxID=1325933 RepID=UPI00058D3546|nr:GNAT family N-acetyltransferase [Clostridium polynesiense]
MSKNITIEKLTTEDKTSAYKLFEKTIPHTFNKEGLASLKEDIKNEIAYKKWMIDNSLELENSNIDFLIAKLNGNTVGTVSFGPCGSDIKRCIDEEFHHIGELGSLFVLPDYQNKGIGSELINAMLTELHKKGVREFSLDSGYKSAQKIWRRKFGEPFKIVKDYWGTGSDHMIWLCKIEDFI